MEVQNAVAAKLAEISPDNLEQFDLLIQDHRSVRRLADETLNDERVVTAENANQLLEAMRQATIQEEKAAFDEKINQTKERFDRRHKADTDALKRTQAQLDATNAALAAAQDRERGRVDNIIAKTNRTLAAIEYTIMVALILMGVFAAYDFVTGDMKRYILWKIVLGAGGLLGMYHFFAHILQKPLIGVTDLLNWLGRRMFAYSLRKAYIADGIDLDKEAEAVKGRLQRKNRVNPDPAKVQEFELTSH